ncbi:HI0074 family nucleotidyltransferase substrate-binding subunit [Mucilaginibacter sp.]|uniref:HI0074 family nucleotidyltransferase substrate-binding subunit n=1 Tax=Mucilaginibacter sp. TaxID=1882438 RepID=UPI00262AF8ED|nr:HI0074 family nucleotidyltransferase substrate-binding subunit [Mucilaginibacter sp.]MDB5030400.1 nucleotidyltransferase substrate binding protein like protein [Mucilaginibacter sp.]
MSDYFVEKLATFDRALKNFKESLLANPSQLERDGAIHRFEYCYDLAWETLKFYLQDRGIIDLYSPKSVFSAAYAEKVIDDEAIWSTIITKRNLSVHTYNQKLADSIFSELPEYYNAMFILLKTLVGKFI